MAITAVLAAAQTIVILTRNIDLSVGSIVGVTAYLTGEYLAAHQTTAPLLAVGLAMLMGCALDPGTGRSWPTGGCPPSSSPSTLAIYRTWLIDHANSRTITADSLPQWLVEFPQRTLLSLGGLDIRLVLAVAVVVILALQVALGGSAGAAGSTPSAPTLTRPGRRVCRSSASPLVRSPCAVPCRGWRASCSCPGSGRSRWPRARAGAGVGRRGRRRRGQHPRRLRHLIGALLGALLIDLLELSLVRVPEVSVFWRDAVLGALILLAISTDFAIGRRLRRLWTSPARRSPRGAGAGGEDGCVTGAALEDGAAAGGDPARGGRGERVAVAVLPAHRGTS